MKKRLFYITTLLLSSAVLSLSSCLKDSRLIDFTKATPVVEFNYGGLSNFGKDAITESTDTVVRQIAVSVTSAAVPTTATTITFAVDNSIITSYSAANPGVTYLPFPAGTYSAPTTVTIPAGQRVAVINVTLLKGLLDPTQSYMLPYKIVSTTGGYTISGNMAIHYFHVIGNDFAGPYDHAFTRTPPNGNYPFGSGHTALFLPDSHTQFEVAGGYYTADIRYVVSFVETGAYPNASYSNFAISINPDDVTRINGVGISITNAPVIVGYDPTLTYNYAGVLALFKNGFTYSVLGGSGARVNLDQYQKP
jgi:hypothetical protein